MWKRTILGSPDPPKPPQGPPGHPRHPRSLKMAQIINNQSSGDYRSQKSNFWGGSIFFSFFTRNDPRVIFCGVEWGSRDSGSLYIWVGEPDIWEICSGFHTNAFVLNSFLSIQNSFSFRVWANLEFFAPIF